MRQTVEFRKIREFGDLISDTFLFIKQNFKPLLKSYYLICGLFVLAGVATTIMQQLQFVNFRSNSGIIRLYQSGSLFTVLGVYYFISMAFMLLNYTAMYVSILSYIALYVQKGNIAPSVEEVWSYFKYYFFRMLGANIAVWVFLVVCFICCILPGIYVFPAMTILYPIMILENGSFGYSFNRAFKLIGDEWWLTAGVLLVIWIITYVFSLVAQSPTIFFVMFKALTNSGSTFSTGYVLLISILSYAAQVFLIIPLICSALVYYNLLERKEQVGLLERINQTDLGASQHQSTPEEY